MSERRPPEWQRAGGAGTVLGPDVAADWLLTTDERGNPATEIDAARPDGRAWTDGNTVGVHVDGAAYFARLHQLLSDLGPGDWVYLTDWRIDATRQLVGPGSELGPLLARLARRGVAIRGLLWRSHPALIRYNQDANRVLGTLVNRAGGQLVADQRVRRFGSHHQKLLVVHVPDDPGRCIAFLGGIDLSRGCRDSPEHQGDANPVRIDSRYGRRPPWHDLQLEVQGPAVLDVDLTFQERWEDHTPRDHRNPLRAMWRRLSHEPKRLGLLPRLPEGTAAGAGAGLRRGPVPVGHAGGRGARHRAARRARAAHDHRGATLSGPGRTPLRPGRALGAVAGRRPPAARRGSACGRVRPGERAGHADLRPRQGGDDRRRLGDGGLGQPQPPLLDPRLRGCLRRARPAPRPSSPGRPGRSGRRGAGVRAGAPPAAMARAPRPRRRSGQRRAVGPGRGLRALAGDRRRAGGLARRRQTGSTAARSYPAAPGGAGAGPEGPLGAGAVPAGDRPRRPAPATAARQQPVGVSYWRATGAWWVIVPAAASRRSPPCRGSRVSATVGATTGRWRCRPRWAGPR